MTLNERDSEFGLELNQCLLCVNYSGGMCPAFPDGVPRDIMLMERDHRFEAPEDNGIRFSAVSDAAAVLVASYWDIKEADNETAEIRRKMLADPLFNAADLDEFAARQEM